MEILTRTEVRDLTGLKKPSAQIKALATMRIPHLERPDGTPVVARSAVEVAMGIDNSKKQDRVTVEVDAI